MILAGDLGGTKSNLGLFDAQREKLVRVAHKRFASSEHSGLEEIITLFLSGTKEKITHASFGIAGPVVNNSTMRFTEIRPLCTSSARERPLAVSSPVMPKGQRSNSCILSLPAWGA